MPEVGPLVERFRQGDRLALSRLLSLAAQGEAIAQIEAALPAGAPRVIAITGSAGVGKSTLIGKLIEHLRTLGTRVAVLACDDEVIPLQSRLSAITDAADLEDVYNTERHLLYVACTRARDRLFVSGVRPASEFLEDLGGVNLPDSTNE